MESGEREVRVKSGKLRVERKEASLVLKHMYVWI